MNNISTHGERPEGLTLDRKDVNGNYCKSNFAWSTVKRQNRNQRKSRLIAYKGQVKCLAEWAEEYGIRPDTLSRRLQKLSIHEALTRPINEYFRNINLLK